MNVTYIEKLLDFARCMSKFLLSLCAQKQSYAMSKRKSLNFNPKRLQPSEPPMVQEPEAEMEPECVVESQENVLSGEIESQTSSLETGKKAKGES